MQDLARLIDVVRCPACLGRLMVRDLPWKEIPGDYRSLTPEQVKCEPYLPPNFTGSVSCVECEMSYPVADGVPELLTADVENPQDDRWMQEYEELAASYDRSLALMMRWLGLDAAESERQLIRRLELKPGMRVLEVSVGTGRNLPGLCEAVGPDGYVVGLDLSPAMLRHAAGKLGELRTPVDLVRGNAAALPFASGEFDMVFHVGGINTFGRKGRALCEMVRVARPGGKILVLDEGIPEGERDDDWYRRIARQNTLYLERPPVDLVPFSDIVDFRLSWVLRRLFYVMEFRKR